MNRVEAEGNSIDEAIERALEQLGVTRDKVDIDIVSNATRGLFGIGGRPAKVRATVRTPLDLISTMTADVATPRPGPMAATQPIIATPTPTPTPVNVIDAQPLERARTVLQEVVRLMGSQAQVGLLMGEVDGARLTISGDATGMLIGRRGQTLDALEYIANRIAAREDEQVGRVVVDSENYRERRRQSLEQLAHRLADRARRRGKTVTLNPMSPRDRRIIHLTLQNDRSLTTRSAGKGYFRKLLIIPEGAERGERQQRRSPRERS